MESLETNFDCADVSLTETDHYPPSQLPGVEPDGSSDVVVASHQLAAGRDAEFQEDLREMIFDGFGGQG